MKQWYSAVGFITLVLNTDYEADSQEEANSLALAALEQEAQDILHCEFGTYDIEDIEVTTS